MGYEVQLPLFTGPLDLLLHLIEREELEITAVSVAGIADQFLTYLSHLQEQSADELSEFLVMATRLVWIKSRALLPRPPGLRAEDDEEDPAEALARQLREYKQYKDAAEWLLQREQLGTRAFVRTAPPPALPLRMSPGTGNVEDLIQAFRQLLLEAEPAPAVEQVVAPVTVTIGQQIKLILQSTQNAQEIGFRRLLSKAASRVEIIVTLLAVLELVKRRRVSMRQHSLFGDIYVAGLDFSPTRVVTTEPPAYLL